MGGVGKNPAVEFHRANARPNWLLTGSFARPSLWSRLRERVRPTPLAGATSMAEAWQSFMGVYDGASPIVLPADATLHALADDQTLMDRWAMQSVAAEVRCRYCRSVARGDACGTCGAPA